MSPGRESCEWSRIVQHKELNFVFAALPNVPTQRLEGTGFEDSLSISSVRSFPRFRRTAAMVKGCGFLFLFNKEKAFFLWATTHATSQPTSRKCDCSKKKKGKKEKRKHLSLGRWWLAFWKSGIRLGDAAGDVHRVLIQGREPRGTGSCTMGPRSFRLSSWVEYTCFFFFSVIFHPPKSWSLPRIFPSSSRISSVSLHSEGRPLL